MQKNADEEVSFEWSHHRFSSTDSKRTTLHVSIIDSGKEGLIFACTVQAKVILCISSFNSRIKHH